MTLDELIAKIDFNEAANVIKKMNNLTNIDKWATLKSGIEFNYAFFAHGGHGAMITFVTDEHRLSFEFIEPKLVEPLVKAISEKLASQMETERQLYHRLAKADVIEIGGEQTNKFKQQEDSGYTFEVNDSTYYATDVMLKGAIRMPEIGHWGVLTDKGFITLRALKNQLVNV